MTKNPLPRGAFCDHSSGVQIFFCSGACCKSPHPFLLFDYPSTRLVPTCDMARKYLLGHLAFEAKCNSTQFPVHLGKDFFPHTSSPGVVLTCPHRYQKNMQCHLSPVSQFSLPDVFRLPAANSTGTVTGGVALCKRHLPGRIQTTFRHSP